MPENSIYIARSSAIAARALAGEMMVMNSADSTFFTLNEVATVIFQAADGHTPLRQIVRERNGLAHTEPAALRAADGSSPVRPDAELLRNPEPGFFILGSKSYGRLSVLVGWRCEARILFDVAPAAFVPPPKP